MDNFLAEFLSMRLLRLQYILSRLGGMNICTYKNIYFQNIWFWLHRYSSANSRICFLSNISWCCQKNKRRASRLMQREREPSLPEVATVSQRRPTSQQKKCGHLASSTVDWVIRRTLLFSAQHLLGTSRLPDKICLDPR